MEKQKCCDNSSFKAICHPPEGYPDPYKTEDGEVAICPPTGWGTDYWTHCYGCGTKTHIIRGIDIERVDGSAKDT